jgi:hypothetical protein
MAKAATIKSGSAARESGDESPHSKGRFFASDHQNRRRSHVPFVVRRSWAIRRGG